jgi:hypothetical protein
MKKTDNFSIFREDREKAVKLRGITLRQTHNQRKFQFETEKLQLPSVPNHYNPNHVPKLIYTRNSFLVKNKKVLNVIDMNSLGKINKLSKLRHEFYVCLNHSAPKKDDIIVDVIVEKLNSYIRLMYEEVIIMTSTYETDKLVRTVEISKRVHVARNVEIIKKVETKKPVEKSFLRNLFCSFVDRDSDPP